MANSAYTNNVDDLGIRLPSVPYLICNVSDPYDYCNLYTNDMKAIVGLSYWHQQKKKLCCSYKTTQWVSEAYCMNLTGNTQKKTTDEDHCYWEQ